MGVPIVYEHLVIGGGLAGLSLASELARAGTQVVCVEAIAPGFGCSSASLGLVYPINPQSAPMEIASLSMEAWRDFATCVRQIEMAAGASALLQSRRLVELKSRSVAAETLAAYATIGYQPALLSVDEAGALVPQLRKTSEAIAYDDVWHLQTDQFVRLQLRAFLAMGGTWLCPWQAEELCFEAGRCVGVRSSSTEIRAQNTILATGAAGTLCDLAAVTPVRGQSVLLRNQTPIGPFIYTETLDIIERLDGSLHVGSTIEDGCADQCTTFEAIEDITRDLNSTLHLTLDPVPLQTLCGIRAKTKDNAPLVGPVAASGLFAFTGLYRNGVVFSQLLARMLAQHTVHGRSIPDWLSPQRFSHGSI